MMKTKKIVSPSAIVIFGGTGDLAKRKLIPAFYNLFLDGKMPEKFEIIGLGRTPLDDTAYREVMKSAVSEFSRKKDIGLLWEKFAGHIFYFQSSIEDTASYQELGDWLDAIDQGFGERGNRLFYLSVAPRFISGVAENIKASAMASDPARDRLVIEKPFGSDKKTAIELNKLLRETFSEGQIYRIDHYLGKQTLQNILTFRFANILFEPVWNASHISSVEIFVDEQVGVEERGGYYETSGALKDMIQNHLLQIMAIVAMEPPKVFGAEEIRDSKVQVLKDVRQIPLAEIGQFSLRGQYAEGLIDGIAAGPYRSELGVDSASFTETFAWLKLFIDNPRWEGVPFYLSSGKRMEEKRSAVVINFRSSSYMPLEGAGASDNPPNRLTINLQPKTDIRMRFTNKKAGAASGFSSGEMAFDFLRGETELPEAYETLLLDALIGDPTLFMRGDQVEQAWEIITPVLDHWQSNATDLRFYPSGSLGPVAQPNTLTQSMSA